MFGDVLFAVVVVVCISSLTFVQSPNVSVKLCILSILIYGTSMRTTLRVMFLLKFSASKVGDYPVFSRFLPFIMGKTNLA